MGGLRLSLSPWAVALVMLAAIGSICAGVWELTGRWGWAALTAGVLILAWSVMMVELRSPSVATQQRGRPAGASVPVFRAPRASGE